MTCKKLGCPGTRDCRGCPEETEWAGLVCDECGEPVRVGELYWCFPVCTLCDSCVIGMEGPELARRLRYAPYTMTEEDAAMYAEE